MTVLEHLNCRSAALEPIETIVWSFAIVAIVLLVYFLQKLHIVLKLDLILVNMSLVNLRDLLFKFPVQKAKQSSYSFSINALSFLEKRVDLVAVLKVWK